MGKNFAFIMTQFVRYFILLVFSNLIKKYVKDITQVWSSRPRLLRDACNAFYGAILVKLNISHLQVYHPNDRFKAFLG